MKKKFIISLGAGGALSILTLYLAFRNVPFDQLAEYLETETQVDKKMGDHTKSFDSLGGNGYNFRSENAQSYVASEQHTQKIGDLCPECGQAAVVNEEGCRKCYACGFSEC